MGIKDGNKWFPASPKTSHGDISSSNKGNVGDQLIGRPRNYLPTMTSRWHCAFMLISITCIHFAVAAKIPASALASASNNSKYGSSGNIGCLFSKMLCDLELEWCYDDYAFGRCLRTTGTISENEMYRYALSKGDMHSLEKQMERLFSLGYRWGHSYTQCVLQNLLEAFRRGGELDESICLDVQDQDLEGALKAFQEDIDPWNLAFIKFSPSAKNPNSDFADESYRPPKELSHSTNGEIVTGKEQLTKEVPTIRIQDRLKQPVLELTSSEGRLLDEVVEPSFSQDVIEQELANTVAKVKGNDKSKGKNKSGKNKGKNKNANKVNNNSKPKSKKSLLNVEYPGQSDNFNGVDIGSAKKDPTGQGWVFDPVGDNLVPQFLKELHTAVEERGVGPDGVADERILQPKIFSSFYNTPDSFRTGPESWSEPAQPALGDVNGPSAFMLEMLGLESDGLAYDDGGVGGGYETTLGNRNTDHRARQEELRLRQEEDDQQIQEAVATLQAAALLNSLLRDQGIQGDDFRQSQPDRQNGLLSANQLQFIPQEQLQELQSGFKDQFTSQQEPELLQPLNLDGGLADSNLLYTEGGLVFLNPSEVGSSDPLDTADEGWRNGNEILKRFISGPQQQFGEESWSGLERDADGNLITPGDEDPETGEYFSPYGYGDAYGSPFYFLNRRSRNGFEFERRERLDVKKPGPWYRTVNNYAFDKVEENSRNKVDSSSPSIQQDEQDANRNPEFSSSAEGPADMDRAEYHDDTAAIQEPKQAQLQQSTLQEKNKRLKLLAVGLEKKSAPVKFETFPVSQVDLGDGRLDIIDTSYANVFLDRSVDWNTAKNLVYVIADILDLERNSFKDITTSNDIVTFKVEPNDKGWNAAEVARRIRNLTRNIENEMGIKILQTDVGIRANSKAPSVLPLYGDQDPDATQIYIATFATCGLVAAVLVAAVAIFLVRKHSKSREKLVRLSQDDPNSEACKDYQDLCRHRMAGSKNNEKMEPIRGPAHKIVSKDSENGSSSSRSSTSSWSEEPVLTNMDISTGHMVLSYMEDHLKNRDRMDKEWESLCAYEADPCFTAVSEKPENIKKNRYSKSLPFDHSRVILNDLANVTGSDYINASTITDHDPRNPAYIASQGPLPNTAADFWQMVWEQGSVVIVNLTRLIENNTALCHRYWPEEGSELHHIYEVHLVSEHIWCDEYLVRSFYLKNLKTGETRTVTQFHFLAWPENGIPQSTKALLEFRRKVNKSYRGRSCPIIVHCSDGAERTGTYCLIDMVLNRMTKGAKEIDIAASLEHIRDQRPGMVRTKQQFEFVLMAVAEEVHAILKALPQ